MPYIGNSTENITQARSTVYTFTSTAGQTVYNGVDNDGQTLDLLRSNQNAVYLNGSRLILTSDYTLLNDVLTLVSAAGLNDVLVIETQTEVANVATYTKAESDARYFNSIGDIVNGNLQVTGSVIAGTYGSGTFTTDVGVTGDITVSGTVDGRDMQTDGTKLDAIEASADVTDTANVTSSGALMDSELTSIAAVKALNQGVATTDAVDFTAVDLTAIAQSKSVTAVDVFVYDTSKDSDGGAWRKRTQATSWYNEALNTSTRGSRKEFPAVAVIVAEAAKVTIYDGDDPSMPMWMVFNRGTGGRWWRYTAQTMNNATAVVMMNGFLGLSTTGNDNGNYGGFSTLNFISDEVERWSPYGSAHAVAGHRYGVTVAEANTTDLPSQDLVNLIVSGHVNDVAMTVLPNAPIDSATGLPIPTIAVATDGGVSVIKDDGSVVDITHTQTYKKAKAISFKGNQISYATQQSGSGQTYWRKVYIDIPSADTSGVYASTLVGGTSYDARGVTGNKPALNTNPSLSDSSNDIVASIHDTAFAFNNKLTLLNVDKFSGTNHPSAPDSSVAYITSDYNTGYMVGDIKLAALSDTDDTDVTDANLITNGTFDTDISGWSSSSFAWNSAGKLERVSGSSNSSASTTFNIVKGKTYIIEYDVVHTGGGNQSNIYFNAGSGSITPVNFLGSGHATGEFTAGATQSVAFNLYGIGDFRGTFDNISVLLVDTDRSVNANGLAVHGTITKTPVATGADLVGYSGFSASNYLEQPYNSDLDFGTGDFSIMLWAKLGIADSTAIYTGTSISNGIHVWCYNTYIKIYVAGQYMTLSSDPYIGSNFAHFTMVRKAGVVSVYTNGELSVTVGAAGSIVYNTMKLGYGFFSGGGTLALARISATVPSAQQIKDIYEAEKPLFQENAQATLYGTSDAVTALAHDDTTNLLHVGTSSGRSVFQGLRRVDNTTTAVGTAISASNNLVVEE